MFLTYTKTILFIKRMENTTKHEMDSVSRSYNFAWIWQRAFCKLVFSHAAKSSEIISPQRRTVQQRRIRYKYRCRRIRFSLFFHRRLQCDTEQRKTSTQMAITNASTFWFLHSVYSKSSHNYRTPVTLLARNANHSDIAKSRLNHGLAETYCFSLWNC